MYLCENTNDNILVYLMDPNFSKIKEYRKNQIINNQKIYKVVSNDKNAPFNLKDLKSRPFTDFSLDDVCYKKRGLIRRSHDIIEIDYDLCLPSYTIDPIQSYYTGGYEDAALVRIYKKSDTLKQVEFVRHLLINRDYTYENEHSNSKYIENIVGITDEAFVLELLKRGHFSATGNADISEQIELFDFTKEPVASIPKKEYLFYSWCGTVYKNDYSEQQINNSQKVLKYARKQGLIK